MSRNPHIARLRRARKVPSKFRQEQSKYQEMKGKKPTPRTPERDNNE